MNKKIIIATAVLVVAILFVSAMVGAVFYYNGILNERNSKIDSLNSQIVSLNNEVANLTSQLRVFGQGKSDLTVSFN